MIISILGSSGFIGSFLKKKIIKSDKVNEINLRTIDLSISKREFLKILSKKLANSDAVINCCASLKPQTKNDFFINSELPALIQKTINNFKKKPHFIHISTLNIFLKQRTDTYTLSKKIGEIKLTNRNTSIIRLPFIFSRNKNNGNLKVMNDYLDNKFLPFYPMIYPGHYYKPIDIDNLCLFIIKLLKSKKKKSFYNLIGKKKMSLWDMFSTIAKKKNKKIFKINTTQLNKMSNFDQRNKLIRNNDFLSQIFSIDHSNFKNIFLKKL